MYLGQQSVQTLRGIGPKKAQLFRQLGIDTCMDLLRYAPFRFDDWRKQVPPHQMGAGEKHVFTGIIMQTELRRGRRGQSVFKALVEGAAGTLVAVWFNRYQPDRQLYQGVRVLLYGAMQSRGGRDFVVTQHVLLKDDTDVSSYLRLQPVYPAIEGLKSTIIEQAVAQLMPLQAEQVPEIFNEEARRQYNMMPLFVAYQQLHYPDTPEEWQNARRTLGIAEVFLTLRWLKQQQDYSVCGVQLQSDHRILQAYLKRLPFQLTAGQHKVIQEILADLAAPIQMHRLLQGDVGSGKTVVAIAAMLEAFGAGYSAVLIAPTELLARQHFNTLSAQLKELDIPVHCLTAALSSKERSYILDTLTTPGPHLVIGTHALLEERVAIHRLGLVVIDEQHRFGVAQRRALLDKGDQPNLLVMTATPIPRSLALTVYGDLDLSVIPERPAARGKIQTIWMKEEKRADMYRFVAEQLAKGRQVYVVCPLIETSEKLDLQDAMQLAVHLQERVFPKYQVALLHGKMHADEKRATMQAFRDNTVQVLVSTTVIEVGIDIANATVMIVENAERFGLAQLHQLRGRVGRGQENSYCILISEANSTDSEKRMRIMVQHHNGFDIADADLALRGPGEFLGLRQHGATLFRFIDMAQDLALLELAKSLAANSEAVTASTVALYDAELAERFVL